MPWLGMPAYSRTPISHESGDDFGRNINSYPTFVMHFRVWPRPAYMSDVRCGINAALAYVCVCCIRGLLWGLSGPNLGRTCGAGLASACNHCELSSI